MSFLKKFRFRHKDETGLGDLKLDDPAFDKNFAPDLGSKPMPTFEQSMSMQQPSGVQQFAGASKGSFDQDMQLLISKIDTLIAKMDNMNQRIANLERIAADAQR